MEQQAKEIKVVTVLHQLVMELLVAVVVALAL
jgi:hypothetical protein